MSDVVITFKGDTSDAVSKIGGLKGALGGLGDFVGGAFKTAAIGAAGLGVGIAAIGIPIAKMGIDFNSMKETAHTAFTTMLGDGAKATQLMTELQDFAASTPFEFGEIAGATKKLLAFGVQAEDVTETLRRVGDISSAIGAPVGEIAELYGKAKVQGRLFGEDINQLTGRGIPIIQQLAKQFGVTDDKVKQLVEEGKVGFPNLEQAFKDLTSEGGQFAGMMEAQSKTFAGQMSTMMDNINQLAGELAQPIFDVLKEGLSGIIALMGTPEFKEGVKQFAAVIATTLKSGIEWLSTALPILIQILKDIGNVFASTLQAFGDKGKWGGAAGAIETFIGLVLQLFGVGEDKAIGFSNAIGDAFRSIQKAIAIAWDFIAPILSAIFAELAKFWEEVQPKLQAAWENIQEVTETIVGAILQFISDHMTEIQAIMDGAWLYIQGAVEVVWALIEGIIKIALDLIAGDFDAAGKDWNTMMQKIWEGIQKIFQGAWLAISTIVQEALNALGQYIADRMGEINNNIKGTFDGILSWFASLPERFFNAGQSIMQSLWDGLNDKLQAVFDIIQSIIDAIGSIPFVGGDNNTPPPPNNTTPPPFGDERRRDLVGLAAGNNGNLGGATVNIYATVRSNDDIDRLTDLISAKLGTRAQHRIARGF